MDVSRRLRQRRLRLRGKAFGKKEGATVGGVRSGLSGQTGPRSVELSKSVSGVVCVLCCCWLRLHAQVSWIPPLIIIVGLFPRNRNRRHNWKCEVRVEISPNMERTPKFDGKIGEDGQNGEGAI